MKTVDTNVSINGCFCSSNLWLLGHMKTTLLLLQGSPSIFINIYQKNDNLTNLASAKLPHDIQKYQQK